jgi:hypothetical protein
MSTAIRMFKRCATVALLGFSALGGVHAAPTTQLGFLVDASGSISARNFQIMRQGYAAALAALPTDGSIEVSIYTFANGAVQVVAPTVVTAASLAGIVAAANGMN